MNDVESDNSPSDTITSISGIIPLKFESGYKYKKLFSIDTVPLSISDTLIFKLVLSISVTNISISRKVSSSIIWFSISWIIGESLIGRIFIDKVNILSDKSVPSKTLNDIFSKHSFSFIKIFAEGK